MKKTIRILVVALVMAPCPPAYAESLQSQAESMFTGMANVTAPQAFKGQTMNTYTAGSMFVRVPNKTYQLLSLKPMLIALNLDETQQSAMAEEVGRVAEHELIGLGLLDAQAVRDQPKEKPLYKKFFPHGTSHHLGLDVHDVGDRCRAFEPGMVFTCEPGFYIREEGIGVRIENDILITSDGPVDLTADVPREADEIEALMREMGGT